MNSTASSHPSNVAGSSDHGESTQALATTRGAAWSSAPAPPLTPADLERRIDIALIAGGGLLLLLVLSGQMYVWINLWPLRIDWWTALAWSLPQALLWSLTIPVIDAIATRVPIQAKGAPWRLAAHVAASVAVALLVLVTLDVSDRVLGWTRLMGAPGTLVTSVRKTILHLHIGIAIYWVVVAANHARRYYRQLADREVRATRLEVLLAEAQLNALRMQLDPHFLFNTLNSIGVLMHRDVGGASRMLSQLSEFLRGTLQHGGSEEVSLRTELDYVRAYLEIERVRFGRRLTVSVESDPGLDRCAVPYLILQPLVENALRHGIARRSTPGTIAIEARSEGSRVRLAVRDNGAGLAPNATTRGLGIGLTNVVKRLEHTYGADHRFELRDADGGGVEALVTIPRRMVGGANDSDSTNDPSADR